MQDVHIIISHWDQLQSMVGAFEEQFAAQQEEVVVLDWGTSYKQEQGYIVIEWDADEVAPAFIDQLNANNEIADFCIYTVPCVSDGQLAILEQPACVKKEWGNLARRLSRRARCLSVLVVRPCSVAESV